MSDRTLVIGAGISGLAAAVELTLRGHEVTVVDAAPTIGGLAASANIGGVTCDRFYHVILESDVATRRWLQRLDLESEIVWRSIRNAFFIDGSVFPFSTARDFVSFAPLGLVDKLRLGATVLHAGRLGVRPRDHDEPILAHLSRLSGRRVCERIWQPLLRAKLGERYSEASAAFIRATIARLFSARKNGTGAERFGFVPGGYSRILKSAEAYLREAGVAFELGRAVKNIQCVDGQAIVTTSQGQIVGRRALVTLPSSRCSECCTQLTATERAQLRQIRYVGVVCVTMLIDDPGSGYYLTNVADATLPFTGIVEFSALAGRALYGGKTLVYLPRYAAPDEAIFDAPESEISESFIAGLRRVRPQLGRIEAWRIDRAREVFAFPERGAAIVAPVQTSVPGLAIANSARVKNATLNVSDTITSMQQAVAELDVDRNWRLERETVRRNIA